MANLRRMPSSLGFLRCSSCGENIDMSALEDHVCAAPTVSKPLSQPTLPLPPSDPAIQQGMAAGFFQLPSRLPAMPSLLPAPAFLGWGKAEPLEIDSNVANRGFAAQRHSSDSEDSSYSRQSSLSPATPSTQLTSPTSMFSRNPYSETPGPPSDGLHSKFNSTYSSRSQSSGASDTGVARFRKGVGLLQNINVAPGPFTGRSHSRSTSRGTNTTKEVESEAVKARPSFRNVKGRDHFRLLSTNPNTASEGVRERVQPIARGHRPNHVDDIDTFLREVASESPFKSHKGPPVPPKDDASFWNSPYESGASKQEVVSQATYQRNPSLTRTPGVRAVDNWQDRRLPPLQSSEAIDAEASHRDGSPPRPLPVVETRPFWNQESKDVDNLRYASIPPVRSRPSTKSSASSDRQISLKSRSPSPPPLTNSRPLWNQDGAPYVGTDFLNQSPPLSPLTTFQSVTSSQRGRQPSTSDSESNSGDFSRKPSLDTNKSDARMNSESSDRPQAGGFFNSPYTDPAIQVGLDTPQRARSHSNRAQDRLYNGGLYSRRPSTTRQYDQPHQTAIGPASNPLSEYRQRQMSLEKNIPEEEPMFSPRDLSLSPDDMFREPDFGRPQPVQEPAPRQAALPSRQLSTKTGPLHINSRALDIVRSNTAPHPSTSRPNCRGCTIPIAGRSVRDSSGRLSGRYHRACFVCTTCSAPFPTGDFYVVDNAPFCQHHYHEKNGTLCASCHTGIEGRYLEADPGNMFHVDCFGCAKCGIGLREDYWEIDGVQYCQRHAFARNEVALRGGGGRPGRDPEKRKTRYGMMYG